MNGATAINHSDIPIAIDQDHWQQLAVPPSPGGFLDGIEGISCNAQPIYMITRRTTKMNMRLYRQWFYSVDKSVLLQARVVLIIM